MFVNLHYNGLSDVMLHDAYYAISSRNTMHMYVCHVCACVHVQMYASVFACIHESDTTYVLMYVDACTCTCLMESKQDICTYTLYANNVE